jgi:glyoxylase-like metal-dependent hydrolase (beta-lactamase superfamily II)
LRFNIQRAVDEIAAANGVSNKVTHLVHTHHHSDQAGVGGLFGNNVFRIGHEETRLLLVSLWNTAHLGQSITRTFASLESVRLDLGYRS